MRSGISELTIIDFGVGVKNDRKIAEWVIGLSRNQRSYNPEMGGRNAPKYAPVHQRMSATWLLNQLPHKNSVAKKLHKLPLTQLFLVRYAESVTEYQLRRIAQFIVESREKHIEIKRWSLFRKVGLSDQRITPDTMRILDSLTYL